MSRFTAQGRDWLFSMYVVIRSTFLPVEFAEKWKRKHKCRFNRFNFRYEACLFKVQHIQNRNVTLEAKTSFASGSFIFALWHSGMLWPKFNHQCHNSRIAGIMCLHCKALVLWTV